MSFNFGSGISGGGGEKKAFNFTSSTTNAPPAFGTGLQFGAPVPTAAAGAAAPGSLLSPSNTTNTGLTFGATAGKMPAFGGFTSPPNQNAAALPFVQTAPAQTGTSQPGGLNLSFGGAVSGTTQPTLGFGQSATSAAPAPTGISFGSPAGGGLTGFSGFKTPASGFSTAPQTAPAPTAASGFGFGTAPTAPNTGLSFGTTTAAGGLSFGSPVATTTGGLGLGAPTAAGGLSFGTPASTTGGLGTSSLFAAPSATALSFGAPATAPGLSFGTNPATNTGLSFATTTAAATGLSFGTAPATTGGLSFGTTPATTGGLSFATNPATTGGLSFGTTPATWLGVGTSAPASTGAGLTVTPAATSAAPTGLSFGTTPASSAPPAFGTTPASTGLAYPTPAAPAGGLTLGAPVSTGVATGLSFGTTTAGGGLGFKAPAAVTTATATSASGFQLTHKTPTSSLSGFSVPTTSAPASTAATSSAASGIATLGQPATTSQSTSMPSLTTTTATTTAAPPPQPISSLTFAQLAENISKWTSQLEEQENLFINQATQINAWDRLLIENGEKIVELNEAVKCAEAEQQGVEHELEFIEGQQRELEALLAPLERDLPREQRGREPEREHMYQLAETLDTQLKQMSEDLKEVIQHLNDTNRSQDGNDPIVQIGRILNAHMSSMQWVDNSIAQISTKLDQLKSTHDALRRDNERSFHLTYN